MCGVSLRISCQRSDLDISSVIFELNGVQAIDGPSTEAEPKIIFGDPVVGRRERSFACATRAPRDTPALGDHGLHAALGCRCRGVDSASRSSILSTAKPRRYEVLAPASPTSTLCTCSSGAAGLRPLDGT